MLDQVKNLQLPLDKLTDLFEQIIIELAELKEFDLARAMLRQTPAMATLKRSAPEKYLRLEHLLQKTYFDEREAYGGGGIGGATTSRERRRAEIAAALSVEVAVVAPSRLVTLIGQVWHRGYRLFCGWVCFWISVFCVCSAKVRAKIVSTNSR